MSQVLRKRKRVKLFSQADSGSIWEILLYYRLPYFNWINILVSIFLIACLICRLTYFMSDVVKYRILRAVTVEEICKTVLDVDDGLLGESPVHGVFFLVWKIPSKH